MKLFQTSPPCIDLRVTSLKLVLLKEMLITRARFVIKRIFCLSDHISDVNVSHWSAGFGSLRRIHLATTVQALRM